MGFLNYCRRGFFMDRVFFIIAAGSAFIAVAAGAFGAHGLRGLLDADLLAVFETGVRYQMYHALALIGVSLACARWPGKLIHAGGWLLVIGSVFFSGSLYLLSLTGIKGLGAITPVGGMLLLAGWLCLAVGAFKSRS
jgi:uncharacterized membrane protein YgdD (TMEM256/DUF423 family)